MNEIGFDIVLVASNPLSTNLDVKNELVENSIEVYWIEDDNNQELAGLWLKLLRCKPDYIIDDGGDLVDLVISNNVKSIRGCCEETTFGVIKETQLQNADKLNFLVVAVNNARTKNLMDNHFETA